MEDKRQEEEMEIDLLMLVQDVWKGVRKFWFLAVLLALAGAAFMYLRSSRGYVPIYQSEATFTVMTSTADGQEGSAGYNFYYDTTTAGQLGTTFPYILGSELLTDAICADMGTEYVNGSISANVIQNSNMVTMAVVSASPEDARAVLESAMKVYPDVARFVLGNIQFNIIDPPSLPKEPYNIPSYTRQTAKGALAGVAAGCLFILLYAFFKRTVRKTEELDAVTSLKCISSLPEVRRRARQRGKKEISILDERGMSGYREGIRSLYIRIAREMEKKEAKVLLITSTTAGEGKSTVARNLAYAMAETGQRVLLLDGDLRKKKDRKEAVGQEDYGLGHVLEGVCRTKQALKKEEESGIYHMPAGESRKRPGSLLASDTMEKLMRELRGCMDYIIVDAPLCELFEDAFVLERYADTAVFVVRYDYVQRYRVLECVTSLSESGSSLLGYVFSGVPVREAGYGYYGYYGYGNYGGSVPSGILQRAGSRG